MNAPKSTSLPAPVAASQPLPPPPAGEPGPDASGVASGPVSSSADRLVSSESEAVWKAADDALKARRDELWPSYAYSIGKAARMPERVGNRMADHALAVYYERIKAQERAYDAAMERIPEWAAVRARARQEGR